MQWHKDLYQKVYAAVRLKTPPNGGLVDNETWLKIHEYQKKNELFRD